MGGRGLYVAMQRGLGPREQAQAPSAGRGRRDDKSPVASLQQRQQISRTQARAPPGPLSPAAVYEALPEDRLDVLVRDVSRRLPQNGARALLLRRLSRGEYEIDGCRVSITMRGAEAIVYATNSDENIGHGDKLEAYLLRAADNALARSMMAGNGGGGPAPGSFASQSVRLPPAPPAPPAAGNPWAGNSGVLVRGLDGGSFLLGSSFYSQASGAHDVQQHHRIEALHLMQAQQLQAQQMQQRQQSQQMQNASRGPSFYMRPENGPQGAGQSRQSIGGYQQQSSGTQSRSSQQAPYGLFGGPSFIAVNG